MKKIIVVTTSLSCGGITSFLIPLLNLLIKEGHEVTLAYTVDTAGFLSRINPKIKTIQFSQHNKVRMLFEWILNFAFYDIYKLISRGKNKAPNYASNQRLAYISAKYIDVFFDHYILLFSSAEGFCNALVALKISASKKIGWVHPDLGKIGLDIVKGQYILNKFDNIIAVSKEGYNTLRNLFVKDSIKFLYIENLIDSSYIRKRAQENVTDLPIGNSKLIVTVCRIANESKRLDRVVRIAKILKQNNYNFKWLIIGDGPDSNLIKSMIKENKLDDCLLMMGGRNNPLPYIKKADVFVLTSQYEGKPVVIEEAKVLHTPIIVTEYTSARDQVLSHLGVVVPNIDNVLEQKIAELIMLKSFPTDIRNLNSTYEYDNKKSIDSILKLLQ